MEFLNNVTGIRGLMARSVLNQTGKRGNRYRERERNGGIEEVREEERTQ
jgi:hypothetical protein